jgi:hypothetical protein
MNKYKDAMLRYAFPSLKNRILKGNLFLFTNTPFNIGAFRVTPIGRDEISKSMGVCTDL